MPKKLNSKKLPQEKKAKASKVIKVPKNVEDDQLDLEKSDVSVQKQVPVQSKAISKKSKASKSDLVSEAQSRASTNDTEENNSLNQNSYIKKLVKLLQPEMNLHGATLDVMNEIFTKLTVYICSGASEITTDKKMKTLTETEIAQYVMGSEINEDIAEVAVQDAKILLAKLGGSKAPKNEEEWKESIEIHQRKWSQTRFRSYL